VALMGEMRGAYKALVGRPNGKRPLRIPMHRGQINIKMDLQEMEWEDIINWITQNKDRWRALVHAITQLRIQ